MGCCGAKRVHTDDKAHSERNLADFKKIALSDKEVATFYEAFRAIDKNDKGMICIGDFLRAIGIDETPLSVELFEDLDTAVDGYFDFREFTLAVWRFCSRGTESIADFTFDLYAGNSDELEEANIQELIDGIFGKRNKKHTVKSMLKSLDKDGNKKISRTEFKESVKKYPRFLYEPLTFQTKLKAYIGDEEFWERIVKSAQSVASNKEVVDLFRPKRAQIKEVKERIRRRSTLRRGSIHFELHSMAHRKKMKNIKKKQKANSKSNDTSPTESIQIGSYYLLQ
mmetsp:Transcript_19940/g.28659  ORF Transcript_19940/g.28659 Transcript_19940/m.28659 type:complete len:282 (+) Transcript_19940:68-913(+)